MTRKTSLTLVLLVLLGSALSVAPPTVQVQATPRISGAEQIQAPRWGSIERETDVRLRRSNVRQDIQAPRKGGRESTTLSGTTGVAGPQRRVSSCNLLERGRHRVEDVSGEGALDMWESGINRSHCSPSAAEWNGLFAATFA